VNLLHIISSVGEKKILVRRNDREVIVGCWVCFWLFFGGYFVGFVVWGGFGGLFGVGFGWVFVGLLGLWCFNGGVFLCVGVGVFGLVGGGVLLGVFLVLYVFVFLCV